MRLLAAGTLFWAQLAVGELALGLVHLFMRPTAVLLNLGIAAALYYLSRNELAHLERYRPAICGHSANRRKTKSVGLG